MLNTNMNTRVLQQSSQGNVFPDKNGGEPFLEIIEHPKSRGFRFRYTCEGPSHGGIPGASSDKNKKTFPAVRICNYQGYARIVVQLVTNEENPRLHPHSLVGKQCQNGICTVQCGPKDMTATFPNLGIQHVTKKNVANILEERYIAAEMQLSSINDGFPQEVQRNIKEEDRKRIASKAQSEAKSIDLSVVRLMFIAYLPDSNGAFTIMLKPVISDAIFDSKAPNAATLKICRMDCNAGSASGGDEVYLLCDKVQKDDIQVRFFEEDMQGNEVWEAYGNFCPTDVHRQFAIVFRTPQYKDPAVGHPVNVQVQLRRRSDGEVSEARNFTYLPNKTDHDMIDRKRRKQMPDFLDHLGGAGGGQGYVFSGTNVPTTFNFQGSNGGGAAGGGGGGKIKEARRPPVKQENPQKGPVDPSMLGLLSQVKQEPGTSSGGFMTSSYRSSQSRSPFSSMSESGSPASNSSADEPQYIEGTQIPMPKSCKKAVGLPRVDFRSPVLVAQSINIQQTDMSAVELHEINPTLFGESFTVQTQQAMLSPYDNNSNQSSQSYYTSQPYNVMSSQSTNGYSPQSQQSMSPHSLNAMSPHAQMTASPQAPSPQMGVDTSTITMDINQFLSSVDDNRNVITANMELGNMDIVNQAFQQAAPTGGSGSLNMLLSDPTMQAALSPEMFVRGDQQNLFLLDELLHVVSDAGMETVQPNTRDKGDYAAVFKSESGSLSDYLNDSVTSHSSTSADTTVSTDASTSATTSDCTVESDAASAITRRMGDMSFGEPSNTAKAKQPISKPSVKASQRTTVVQTQQTTRTTAIEQAVNLNEQKLSQALYEKMTSALQDYSVSGDVRMLLVFQRHLATGCDKSGDSVLHLAVIHDQIEALSYLLDVIGTMEGQRDIINRRNNQLQTALHIAAMSDNVDAVIELLKFGANPLLLDKNGNNVLHIASRHGNADILSRALNSKIVRLSGSDTFDVRNYSGSGCFHLAAKARHSARQCLKLLSSRGFDVNLADSKSGRTALHVAVAENNLVVVGCLVTECNASINVATYDGYSPLHLSASLACYEITTLLLACGADPDLSTVAPDSEEEGEKPIDVAMDDKIRDILRGKRVAEFTSSEFHVCTEDESELRSLDPVLYLKLCKLLNKIKPDADWMALADRLSLTESISHLKSLSDPTKQLIEHYIFKHGTVAGLRSALLHIGRHDAVQLLNRAVISGPCYDVDNDLSERFDSAIGSLNEESLPIGCA